MSKTFDHVDYLTHMVNKLDKENKELKQKIEDLEMKMSDSLQKVFKEIMSDPRLSMCKSKWGAGPWQDEPDELKWVDEETGYKIEMDRNPVIGIWLGYVCIPKTHSLFRKHYNEVDGKFEVHGGLTYSGVSREDENYWVFGFDCGHCFDFLPGTYSHLKDFIPESFMKGITYKDIEFARKECISLAKQLKEYE